LKRSDGYHGIASLYQAITLFDTLYFAHADSFKLTSSDPTLPLDDSNLICKAVDPFCQKTGASPSVHIHLEKNIPVQAGLGGGSGNAATTLWGLNRLLSTGASNQQLALWSAELARMSLSFFFRHKLLHRTGRNTSRCHHPPHTAGHHHRQAKLRPVHPAGLF
jgi:4-diphosphocytidyl-2-C-methyl-D-erythritol kinase